ncbi:maturation protein [ssRNA phage Gephyllon.1_12]|uniref:Maturation protein n=2 Tax=Norzivirales TaxID=2842247 RepID=A0A8S5KXG3_9VIRU|nr:maturation protein [ssRNA phage Gephyllon.1_12]QDH88520.1 MAG: hypothetical protein H1BulkLitter51011_000002 [Leviviridae sp.]DAD50001.1 TPA_asm: maturation protein [ssRNA phage Gephyllon.1_12]
MTSKIQSRPIRRYARVKVVRDGAELVNNTVTHSIANTQNQVGFDKPNYESLTKLHLDAGNQYTADFKTVTGGRDHSFEKTYDTVGLDPFSKSHWKETVNGFLGDFGAVTGTASGSTSAQNRALGDFSRRAAKAISPFSSGVFLGELREAIHMIKHPAQALFDEVKSYAYGAKKLRKRMGPRGFKKVSASLWLEAAYGWRPLVSDVKSGAEALSRCVNGFVPNSRIRSATTTSGTMVQAPTSVLKSYQNMSWRFFQSVSDEATYRVDGAVRIGPAGTLAGNLDTFGVSWDQVLPTAWELLPFSFVTDYFSNVGDVISSASIVNGRVIYAAVTSKFERKVQYAGWTANTGGQDNARAKLSAGPVVVKIIHHNRTPLSSVVPSIQFECPGIGSMKWLNLGALYTALS